jgi:hypothetical protein
MTHASDDCLTFQRPKGDVVRTGRVLLLIPPRAHFPLTTDKGSDAPGALRLHYMGRGKLRDGTNDGVRQAGLNGMCPA